MPCEKNMGFFYIRNYRAKIIIYSFYLWNIRKNEEIEWEKFVKIHYIFLNLFNKVLER